MQPALSTPFAQPPIPAMRQLSEKPRLGFTSKNPALHLGQSVCNSTAAIGMRAGLALNRVRSRCSAEQYDSDLGLYYLRARYYNPLTGRFLSRDPEDGQAKDSASLHKYLYADGDPINGIDPMGREDLITNLVQIAKVIVKVEAARNFAIFCTVATLTVEAALFEYLSDEHLSVLDKAAVFGAVGGCVAVLPAFLAVAGW
jgi:RHS repeat-associated protein